MCVCVYTLNVCDFCTGSGTTCNVLQQSVRWASKSKKHNTIGKRRGYKKYEDDYVESGMILFRQFGLKVYPGENVSCVWHCISSSKYKFVDECVSLDSLCYLSAHPSCSGCHWFNTENINSNNRHLSSAMESTDPGSGSDT